MNLPRQNFASIAATSPRSSTQASSQCGARNCKAIIAGLALVLLPLRASAADTEAAKKIFTERCASCHGDQGAGDGPVGKALPEGSKPRNFQTEAFKFAVDAGKFKELLKKGGAGVGLSPIMPPQADLSDDQLEGLYAYVKSLAKK